MNNSKTRRCEVYSMPTKDLVLTLTQGAKSSRSTRSLAHRKLLNTLLEFKYEWVPATSAPYTLVLVENRRQVTTTTTNIPSISTFNHFNPPLCASVHAFLHWDFFYLGPFSRFLSLRSFSKEGL
ncbi:hypothetical protein HAX54_048226 [Datura stramonium]|uniref:Uncharacterized protein n=1 Tax=Datura stramonium TaxID=4076 RepID=A0ABS8SVA7_DATST|nr:hypothetical protein [Datura stramonium]